jgi:hypothetical protein
LLALVVLAGLVTGLNACKPLHIDDTAYFYFARQIAQHPLDPYGFSLLWYNEPNEANDLLAPPVLPAWWALNLKLFGREPWLWKIGLFPWCLLLALSLYALLGRFTPGLEMSLTWLTVLSPALLPSLNLMLDVPALALSLAAVGLFLRACDGNSHVLAILAGFLAGLAAETKYTAFLAPGVMLAAAATRRRWGLWPAALAAALQTFCTWELLTAILYERSHFLNALRFGGKLSHKLYLLIPLFDHLGGVLPTVVLLALAALGCRRRWRVAAAAGVVLGFVLVAVVGNPFAVDAELIPLPLGLSVRLTPDYQIAHTLFFLLGLGSVVVMRFVLVRLLAAEVAPIRARRDTQFLVLWLALELVGYVVLTPFAAVRRLLGLAVVLTLLSGRLAARAPGAAGRSGVGEACGFGIVLGLAFFALDLREAEVQCAAAADAAAWIRQQGNGRVWYVGHWGWQFHAESNGMEPVIVAYEPAPGSVPLPRPSRLRAGDWLVVPDERVHRQSIELDAAHLREEVVLWYADGIPLRTVPCYYAGIAPVEHHDGDRLRVQVYRVTSDFTPQKARKNNSRMPPPLAD